MRVPQANPTHDYNAYRCFLPDLTGFGSLSLQDLKAQRICEISRSLSRNKKQNNVSIIRGEGSLI